MTTPTVTRALLLCVLALAGSSACERHRPGAPSERAGEARNAVVISLCSVRADHMSLYGYRRATTPALDAFARDAWVFEHAVTQWPKTVPAFAALLTARYGHSTGVMRVTPRQKLDGGARTLAEVLAERGFATAAFVSSGVLHAGTNVFQQGFAHVDETFRLDHAFEETTRRAAEWIGAQGEKPFLAWVHYNNAHAPYRAPGAEPETFVDDALYDRRPRVRINAGRSSRSRSRRTIRTSRKSCAPTSAASKRARSCRSGRPSSPTTSRATTPESSARTARSSRSSRHSASRGASTTP